MCCLSLAMLLAEALITALAAILLTGLPGSGLFAAAGWLLISGTLGVAAAAPPWGTVAAPAYRLAVRHARKSGIPLAEVASLAAAPAYPRAVTALGLRLVEDADTHGITVLARARNQDLAAIYLRLDFEHAGGHPLILIRHPRRPRRRPLSWAPGPGRAQYGTVGRHRFLTAGGRHHGAPGRFAAGLAGRPWRAAAR
jgi:hypothetical protein